MSSSFFIVRYNKLSSANNRNCVPGDIPLCISFMYIRNKRGPSTVPCGTPDSTGAGSDTAPSTTTTWLLLDRKDSIHLSVDALIP